MEEFEGRVAVVTGAASGMGLAFSHRFAKAGMKVVLADIESEPLAMAESALRETGAAVLAVRTDVSREEDINRLADAAFSTFGNVHVLCNNAGVAATAATLRAYAWEGPLSDWEWTLGVNFMGVLYGIRAFVPRMLENGEEGHVVNTASMAGLLTGANPYNVSKHGVVCLTEGMYRDFKAMGAKLSASVLCPGLIRTAILDAERNRPRELGATDVSKLRPEVREWAAGFAAALSQGIDPADVADMVFDAIRDDRFYIFPCQPEVLEAVRRRMTDIIEARNPSLPG
jgi:NAD(P)-dependent dehydrogenase (short-subunit alcohol dehydrogenase family)